MIEADAADAGLPCLLLCVCSRFPTAHRPIQLGNRLRRGKGTLKESLRLEYAPLGEEPGRNSCCGVGFSTCEKVQKITSSADASKAAPLARSNSPAYRWTSPG